MLWKSPEALASLLKYPLIVHISEIEVRLSVVRIMQNAHFYPNHPMKQNKDINVKFENKYCPKKLLIKGNKHLIII